MKIRKNHLRNYEIIRKYEKKEYVAPIRNFVRFRNFVDNQKFAVCGLSLNLFSLLSRDFLFIDFNSQFF